MKDLGEILVERGHLDALALADAVADAARSGDPLRQVLLRRRLVDEQALLRALGEQYGLPYVSLRDEPIDPAAVRCLPAKYAAHYGIMPVRMEGNRVVIAVSDPLNTTVAEDIRTNLGLDVGLVLAGSQDILETLRRHYGVGAETVERLLAEGGDRDVETPKEESHDLERMAEDTSVVRLVNQLMQEAIESRATDIHFEAYRDGIVARRRIDGILWDTSLPRNIRSLYPAIVSRIKLMAGLNIVERRLPQDGRSRVRIGPRDYDLRVSVVPAIHGEDIVIRILPATMIFDLGELGFSTAQLKTVERYIAMPHGIIFVTGPTGSGKSTTLYACLSRLNTRDRKIITIEDPVEYELKGITQTQVNPKIGLTFAHALRGMLRHDPDVMLVGEVRDRETAEIAVQTAMTGHLVLSSLHTNDAAGAAVRLMDMGIDPYLIASTVRLFIAQRLVRTLCTACRDAYDAGGGTTRYRAPGCRTCNGTGYRGRMAISEFIPLDPAIQALVLARASAQMIRSKADELGMATMAGDGADKVALGLTTNEEVLRVTTL